MNRVIFAFRDERPKLNHATIQRIARDLDQAHPMSFSPLANEILRRLKSLDRTAAKAGSGYGASQSLRSEEHTSELQSLMRISYAVFCLKKKNQLKNIIIILIKQSTLHRIT